MIKHLPVLFLSFFLLNSCINQEKKSPNILLIMIDDLNDYNEDLNGHPQVITPNIKNFAKSAVSFKNAYSTIQCVVRPDPVCYLVCILITPLTFGKDHGCKIMFCRTQKP